MAYRMIVLDLDGTLTNRDKVITPRTKEALMKLKSQGGTIVLASGRPTYGAVSYTHLKKVLGGRAGGMPEMVFEYILKKNGIDPAADPVSYTHLDVYKRQVRDGGGTGGGRSDCKRTGDRSRDTCAERL